MLKPECHLLFFCREEGSDKFILWKYNGASEPIKHHILSKINKQVYQAGNNSSFQETPDLFLPRATGLPGKWVNTVNSAWVLLPAGGKCTESKEGNKHFFKWICLNITAMCLVSNKHFYLCMSGWKLFYINLSHGRFSESQTQCL